MASNALPPCSRASRIGYLIGYLTGAPAPDMMEEFYAKERSFRDMIAEMGRRYAPLLGADDDPRMRQIKKYLFQNEMRKRLMRPPSGEFDI